MAQVVNALGIGVEAHGLRELVKALRASGEQEILDGVRDANVAVAELVMGRARGNATGSLERQSAAALVASRTAAYAQIRLGGEPFALGAEFGAHRNLRRLVKAPQTRTRTTKKGKTLVETVRTRATIVRDGESVVRVARRVESQYVDRKGRNVGRRAGGERVELERTARGGVKVVRGWNQFKPWRGNDESAGYFLWPAIRESRDEILTTYADALDKLVARQTAAVSPTAAA